MTSSDPRRMAFRLWVVLVLLVIGIQSASPVPAPLDRIEGSAFSAATADVTINTQRRELHELTEARITPHRTAPAIIAEASQSGPQLALPAPGPRLRPEARGPPPRDRMDRVPDPRGPPLT